ncbi:MAG TPA: VOC family protein [Pyrinomonadaceae bacterium]|nr:VOC family protein [Pyrinomonadaceae bacterium]
MKQIAFLVSIFLLLVGPVSFVNNLRVNGAETHPLVRTYGLKINVDDMRKALSFYEDKLGFEVEGRGTDYAVLKSAAGERLILNRVKQLRALGPADTQLSFTLQVNDLDRAIERMKALGIEFGEKERRREAVGDAIFIKDPFGRRISLMHQTVVKAEPFKEPRLYNFGFLVPDMQAARDFYGGKLGFVVRSEKYLPLDLPLGHTDKSFAFMLHYRPGVTRVLSDYPRSAPFNTLVLETDSLRAAAEALKARGVKILDAEPREGAPGSYLAFEDPFGNVSELLEVAGRPARVQVRADDGRAADGD